MLLYVYRIKTDSGNAPNPFGGIWTFFGCKPGIEEHAKEGDLVFATSCVDHPAGPDRLVSAARVTAARRVGGGRMLLSTDRVYYGDRPVEVPTHLLGMIPPAQGYRSKENAPYAEAAERWFDDELARGVLGQPTHPNGTC